VTDALLSNEEGFRLFERVGNIHTVRFRIADEANFSPWFFFGNSRILFSVHPLHAIVAVCRGSDTGRADLSELAEIIQPSFNDSRADLSQLAE
jgi:hypothetical protein